MRLEDGKFLPFHRQEVFSTHGGTELLTRQQNSIPIVVFW
jgi:hypothetical protein